MTPRTPSHESTVLLASGNARKLAWVRSAFADSWVQIEPATAAVYQPVEEVGDRCEDNAWAKVRAVRSDGPVMAEDSGLFVAALDGRPGTHTARWFPGSDADRARRLLDLLEGATDRTATFVSVVAVSLSDGQEFTATGQVTGTIARNPPPRVTGYHDIFVTDPQPFPPDDAIPPAPHRQEALRQARTHLEQQLADPT